MGVNDDVRLFSLFVLVNVQCGWYWGPMNWEDAEMKLKGKADGSFLVRDSSDPRYILSLSFRSQGVTHHTRMEHYRGEMCISTLAHGLTQDLNQIHIIAILESKLFTPHAPGV